MGARHKEELQKVLLHVMQLIEHPPTRVQTHPPRYARLLWSELRGESNVDCDKVPNWPIRRIHDFYGWKAKEHVNKRGVCAGALYRSARYLMIPQGERSGCKRRQNVHIEHTVPVAVLMKALRHRILSFATPSALHGFLMHHSICTALSYEEKGRLSSAGVSTARTPAFYDDGQVGDFPFMRYMALADEDHDFRLFNIVSGQEIEIAKFSFADHYKALVGASRLVMPDADGDTVYSLAAFKLH
jgi:hypothetical protein